MGFRALPDRKRAPLLRGCAHRDSSRFLSAFSALLLRLLPLGLPSARQAVASYYRKVGLPTRPEPVLITNGAQHAIVPCAALYLQRAIPCWSKIPLNSARWMLSASPGHGYRLCPWE